MSIRNIDADLATNKLNELFHLHRYDDCVLYINRLNHLILKKVVSQLPISMYLSRLPYTMELFEAIYAKIFIIDPDNFPIRTLQPERLIDKMVAYFSLLNDQTEMEPIDGIKMLESFENVIRIISYIQPNLYSRLLYFKYAIDRACLKFDKDLNKFNKYLSPYLNDDQLITQFYQSNNNNNNNNNNINNNIINDMNTNSYSATSTLNRSKHKHLDLNQQIYTNALLISRASNMQTCEKIKIELVQTINNCHKALLKLNEYLNSLKSQKNFKQIQSFMNENVTSSSSTKSNKRNSSSVERSKNKNNKEINEKNEKNGMVKSRSESVFNLKLKSTGSNENSSTLLKSKSNLSLTNSALCQDFIQNRLYLNKAMMNTIETFLTPIKLQQMMANLYEKIDLDKEILLVFTHLKREENYLNSLEPLQPLFKRYSLGFERCIQIWRKKCSADSLLLINDTILNEPEIEVNSTISNYSNKSNLKSNTLTSSQKQRYLSINNNKEENDALIRSNSSTINRVNLLAESSQQIDELNSEFDTKCQKYFSDVNLYTNPAGYSTMPAKFRTHKKILSSEIELRHSQSTQTANNSNSKNDMGTQSELVTTNNDSFKRKTLLTRNVEIQTSVDLEDVIEESKMLKKDLDKEIKEKKSLADEIERLKQELENANNTINRLKKNENKLLDKLKEKEEELNEKDRKLEQAECIKNKQTSSSSSSIINDEAKSSLLIESIHSYQYTSELINVFNNLNNKYRIQAYESLDKLKDIKTMTEFKIKLLFSVVVLSYRYVKLYIRELKRKIRTILQINERGSSRERTNSLKSQITPTIIIEKVDDTKQDTIFFGSQENEISTSLIDQSINKYLQLSAYKNSFDLKRVIEDVKDQLWTTLQEYPLKECHELNAYITECVHVCWSLINHEPVLKFDYSNGKFDSNLHERYESNKNEQIMFYVWPCLIDSSNNKLLSKGIVAT